MQRSYDNLMAMLKPPYVFFKDLLRIGNPGLTNGGLLKRRVDYDFLKVVF